MIHRKRAFHLILVLLIFLGLFGCNLAAAGEPAAEVRIAATQTSLAATGTAVVSRQSGATTEAPITAAAAETPRPSATADIPAATSTLAPTATAAAPEPFSIQDPAFTPADEQDCTTDATITAVNGTNVSATGTIAFRNNGFVFWCYGARHAWKGTLTYSKYTFSSEEGNPLTFVIDRRQGYLYQSGAGIVTLPDGKQVHLPQDGAPAGGSMPPTSNPVLGPALTQPASLEKTYLSDLKPVTWKIGYGRFSVGKFAFTSGDASDNVHSGDPIMVNGKPDPHAVFAHATSKIVYKLDGKYSQLLSTIGLVEKISCGDGAIFQVFVDGREVFRYGPMMPRDAPIAIVANLAYGNEMTLATDDGEYDDWYCDWTIWGDAFVR